MKTLFYCLIAMCSATTMFGANQNNLSQIQKLRTRVHEITQQLRELNDAAETRATRLALQEELRLGQQTVADLEQMLDQQPEADHGLESLYEARHGFTFNSRAPAQDHEVSSFYGVSRGSHSPRNGAARAARDASWFNKNKQTLLTGAAGAIIGATLYHFLAR